MAVDEQDGKIEKATDVTRIRGKETQSSTQIKKQVTVTDAQPEDKVLLDVGVVRGANPGANIKTGRDERSYDIPAGVILYGRLSAGGPRDIRVEELAEE